MDVVVGFGGYASAPAYVAAHREGVPIAIHEANAKPGIANRLGARYTKHVGVAFRGTRLRGATWVGQPLRVEIERIDRFSARRDASRTSDSTSPSRPCSSRAARPARSGSTTPSPQSIATILGTGWQVIHVAGAFRDEAPTRRSCRATSCASTSIAWISPSRSPISSIGRAGTSTVAELTALGIPAVFVPYASGNGEQRLNAREAVAAGGAIVVRDADFTPDWVARELVPLLSSRARIADMAARMATVGALDGSDRMADLVERAAADGAAPTRLGLFLVTIKPDLSVAVPETLGKVHFVGIGGSGMSGIAHMFLDAGIPVSGSDRDDGPYLQALRDRGATIHVGHAASNVGDADTIVVTSALWPDNPELLAARERGILVLHRSQALHFLSRGKRVVSVAGAHGKTTSTGMIVTMLRGLGVDPSFVNGGVIQSLKTSMGTGTDDLFVLEADESDGSFLLYDTAVALITNVDADHLDHFGEPAGLRGRIRRLRDGHHGARRRVGRRRPGAPRHAARRGQARAHVRRERGRGRPRRQHRRRRARSPSMCTGRARCTTACSTSPGATTPSTRPARSPCSSVSATTSSSRSVRSSSSAAPSAGSNSRAPPAASRSTTTTPTTPRRPPPPSPVRARWSATVA